MTINKNLIMRSVWYWTSMLWSIDTCQNKISADQYRWPYRGLKLRTHRGQLFFFSWPLIHYWFPIGSQAQVRPKRSSALGLPKYIYYYDLCVFLLCASIAAIPFLHTDPLNNVASSNNEPTSSGHSQTGMLLIKLMLFLYQKHTSLRLK